MFNTFIKYTHDYQTRELIGHKSGHDRVGYTCGKRCWMICSTPTPLLVLEHTSSCLKQVCSKILKLPRKDTLESYRWHTRRRWTSAPCVQSLGSVSTKTLPKNDQDSMVQQPVAATASTVNQSKFFVLSWMVAFSASSRLWNVLALHSVLSSLTWIVHCPCTCLVLLQPDYRNSAVLQHNSPQEHCKTWTQLHEHCSPWTWIHEHCRIWTWLHEHCSSWI